MAETGAAGEPVTHVKRDRVSIAAGTALVLITLLSIVFAREAAFNHDEFYFLDAAKTLALQGKYATVANGQLKAFDPYTNTPGSKSVMTDCVSLDSLADAVRVELTTNRSFVPRQIGLNTDTRVLALQLRDIEFHPEHACSAPRR